MTTTTTRAADAPRPSTEHAPTASSGSQLRLVVAGSVDDGKSTLVGRLLHDTKNILADTYDSMVAASTSRGAEQVDLALLTDGLRAEREQGITIDVAYRYFSTPRRTFVLADTPGHVQYTRNMVTGASTADAAVVLVDARHGVSAQTRRHIALMALLRVPHVIVAVNKMDAVDWSPARFDEVRSQVVELADKVGLAAPSVVAVSALTGDGVVAPAPAGFDGPPLLDLLEAIPVRDDLRTAPFRLPVQLVIRPRTAAHPDYRGVAGRIASGSLRVGDRVRAATSGLTSTVAAIDTPVGPREQAGAGESVTIRLADELDIARGEVMTRDGEAQPVVSSEVTGVLAWLAPQPPRPRARVLVKAGTKVVRAVLEDVTQLWDVETSAWHPADGPLTLNAIGRVTLRLAEPVALDAYATHRATGAFLVLDPAGGATLGAGMSGDALGADSDEASAPESEEDWLGVAT